MAKSKTPGPDGFTTEFIRHTEKTYYPFSLEVFQKKQKRREYSQTHSMKLISP